MESFRSAVYHPKINLPSRQVVVSTQRMDPGCSCGNHVAVNPQSKTLGVDCEHEPGFGMFLVGVCVLASALFFCRKP